MLHKHLEETKLLHGQLKWLAASPNPDCLPIEKELPDNYQVLQRSLCCVVHLIHAESRYWSTLANLSSKA
jgi:hypothetical protein